MKDRWALLVQSDSIADPSAHMEKRARLWDRAWPSGASVTSHRAGGVLHPHLIIQSHQIPTAQRSKTYEHTGDNSVLNIPREVQNPPLLGPAWGSLGFIWGFGSGSWTQVLSAKDNLHYWARPRSQFLGVCCYTSLTPLHNSPKCVGMCLLRSKQNSWHIHEI